MNHLRRKGPIEELAAQEEGSQITELIAGAPKKAGGVPLELQG
jgi:hypothetical protein